MGLYKPQKVKGYLVYTALPKCERSPGNATTHKAENAADGGGGHRGVIFSGAVLREFEVPWFRDKDTLNPKP